MYKDEISRANSVLMHKKIKIHRVLESLIGDPILSHWIGADGIVAGTALGRISAYLFDCKTLVFDEDTKSDKLDSVCSEDPRHESASPDTQEGKENDKSEEEHSCQTPVDDEPEASSTHAEASGDVIVEIKEDLPSTHKSDISVSPMGEECSKMPEGKYTVFATFSDEPVYAAFICNRLLYCMIGTSSICIYDVDAYSIKEEYGLQLSRNAGYKQVLFSDHKVLIESVRGSTVVDPVIHKQSITYARLCPCNILDFNGNMMIGYGKSEDYNVMVFCMDESKLESRQIFSVTLSKKVHLVTHGKFWGHGKIVIVCDMLDILVFNYLDNVTDPVAKTRVKADIVDICCGFPSFLILLTKNSKISLLHRETLEIFYSLSVFPATFEIGWPYTIINHENMLSFTADEGVYCLELPKEVNELFKQTV